MLDPDSDGDLEVHVIDRTLDNPGRLRILRADPQIRISEELVEALRTGQEHPDVSFGDNILTIHGVNRTVSYGLVGHDYARRWWFAVKSPEPDDQVEHPS